ncbi:hypothetical protein OU798_15840 [Prolixibacteraceae bacterium Z1-6]|uniref:Uncharacterized protein n=1 Tax=Draconibacterium aestuarii TaxID=2998507 RepID=A0A9X3FAR3_9BACT|nr:hypothetical protein [Prolixibacteraceae bacterium Z1-6]
MNRSFASFHYAQDNKELALTGLWGVVGLRLCRKPTKHNRKVQHSVLNHLSFTTTHSQDI